MGVLNCSPLLTDYINDLPDLLNKERISPLVQHVHLRQRKKFMNATLKFHEHESICSTIPLQLIKPGFATSNVHKQCDHKMEN